MRRLLILIVAIAGALIFAPAAQAHVLESDGGVSAVLHMPPDDDPKVGEQTVISLAFASDDPAFDLKDYRIEVSLTRSDADVDSSTLQPDDGSSRDGSAVVVFPEPGSYRLKVAGTVKDGSGSNGDFELTYGVRASDGEGGALDSIGLAGFDFWALSLGSLALLVLTARYQIRQGGRYQPRPTPKKP